MTTNTLRAPTYSSITEGPRARATSDQLKILYTRYHWAAAFAAQQDVLEIACGTGVGLGYLARTARSVTGGDIDLDNIDVALQTYAAHPSVRLCRLNAETLHFPDGSFDVVMLLEALYYLEHPESFFREARRVLRPGGKLLISSVNCSWSGFNRSPFSTRYFTAPDLADAMARHGFTVTLAAGFPDTGGGAVTNAIRQVRRAAVKLRLFPKTMKGKEWLKRAFYGELHAVPSELTDGCISPEQLVPMQPRCDFSQYRMLYAAGTLQEHI